MALQERARHRTIRGAAVEGQAEPAEPLPTPAPRDSPQGWRQRSGAAVVPSLLFLSSGHGICPGLGLGLGLSGNLGEG